MPRRRRPAASRACSISSQRTAVNTYASSRRLQEIGKNYQPKVPYPQHRAGQPLKLAAQLIDAGLGRPLFYVSLDGFDTHAGQAAPHANLLREVSDAITAFYKDLAAARPPGPPPDDDVLRVRPARQGERQPGHRPRLGGADVPGRRQGQGRRRRRAPQPDQPGDGNLRHHTDFRQVYAAVLDTWLGVPSRQVLGQEFKPVDVLRA